MIIRLTVLFLLSSYSLLSAQSLDRNFSFGGSDDDNVSDMTVDSLGNVYVTGSFTDTCDFDPSGSVEQLIGEGRDVYVCKYSALGELIWAKRIGGIGNEYGSAIEVSDSGNVYVAGTMNELVVDFDPGPNEFLLSGYFGGNAFAFKLDENGSFEWARVWNSVSEIRALDVDNNEQVYFAGSFMGTIDFDPPSGSSSSTLYAGPNNSTDAFVLKLNWNGDYVWVKQIEGNGTNYINSIESKYDKLLIGGSFLNTCDFDLGPGINEITSNGVYDCFVSQLNQSGDLNWVTTFGGVYSDRVWSSEFTTDSSVVVTGSFQDSVAIITENSDTLHWIGGEGVVSDCFNLKLNQNGAVVWGNSWGTALNDRGVSICTDNSGSVYSSGFFRDTLELEMFGIPFRITPNGNYDGFILKHNAGGELVWARSFGGTDSDEPVDIVNGNSNTLLITGNMRSNVDFSFGNTPSTLTSVGGSDVFIGQYSICNDTVWEMNATSCDTFHSASGHLWFESGLYYDILRTDEGCDSIVEVDLQIVSTTAIASIEGNTVVSQTTADSIRWLDCENSYMPILGATQQTFNPDAPGLFALQAYANGCVDTSSCLEIPCSANFSLYPDPQQAHSWFALDSSFGLPPFSYSWDWGDGNSSVGMNVSHVYDTAGYYNICLTVIDADGCNDTICDNSTYLYKNMQMVTINAVTQLPNSVTEYQPNANLLVYPNPTSSNVIIDIGYEGQEIIINTYNMQGKLLKSEKRNSNGQIEFKAPEPKGVYVINLICSGRTVFNFKIVRD